MTKKGSARMLPVFYALTCALAFARPAHAGCELVVDKTGRGTHTSIQGAVDDLPNSGPCTITVRPGLYREAIALIRINTAAAANAERIVIVGEKGAILQTDGRNAFAVSRSRFVTLQGFRILGAAEAAVMLAEGDEANSDITIASNDLHNNGGMTGGGGIVIGAGNVRTWVVNNLVRNNTRNGITIRGGSVPAAAAYLVNNTIVANAWNGVSIGQGADVYIVNNAIVGNGVAAGTVGGRWGLMREITGWPSSGLIAVDSNLFYLNGADKPDTHGGDIGGLIGAATSVANVTTGAPAGSRGAASCALAGCTAASGLAPLFVGRGLGPVFRPSSESTAIARGRGSFVVDGQDWVPKDDFDGMPRAGERVTVGYLEVARQRSNQ